MDEAAEDKSFHHAGGAPARSRPLPVRPGPSGWQPGHGCVVQSSATA